MYQNATVRGAAGLAAATLSLTWLAGCASSTTDDPRGDSSLAAPAVDMAYDGPEKDLPTAYEVTRPSEPFTVGVQVIFIDSGQLAQLEGIREEVEALGGTVMMKDDQGNPTTQVNNCNTLIAQKVDAIIVYPFDPQALKPCFEAAAAAGIKVVAQQTPVDASPDPLPAPLQTDILQGFDYAAYLRAQEIARVAPGSSYVYVNLGIPIAALEYAKDRMIYWADRFGLEHIGDVDTRGPAASDAAAAMTSVLSKYPSVENVFVYNVDAALAASTVARASGNTDVRVIGYNGTAPAIEAIQQERLFATVLVDVVAEGKNLADAAATLIAGGEVPKYVTTPNTLVTRDNADSVTPIG